VRYVNAFGRFWWDFLVGDTPELFLATLFLVGLAFALRKEQAAAVPILILAAVGCLGLSAWRGRRRKVTQREGADSSDPAGAKPEAKSEAAGNS
jgi:hypothetical protein